MANNKKTKRQIPYEMQSKNDLSPLFPAGGAGLHSAGRFSLLLFLNLFLLLHLAAALPDHILSFNSTNIIKGTSKINLTHSTVVHWNGTIMMNHSGINTSTDWTDATIRADIGQDAGDATAAFDNNDGSKYVQSGISASNPEIGIWVNWTNELFICAVNQTEGELGSQWATWNLGWLPRGVNPNTKTNWRTANFQWTLESSGWIGGKFSPMYINQLRINGTSSGDTALRETEVTAHLCQFSTTRSYDFITVVLNKTDTITGVNVTFIDCQGGDDTSVSAKFKVGDGTTWTDLTNATMESVSGTGAVINISLKSSSAADSMRCSEIWIDLLGAGNAAPSDTGIDLNDTTPVFNQTVMVNTTVSDDNGLDYWLLQHNCTADGSYQNTTPISLAGATYQKINWSINASLAHTDCGFTVFYNDTDGEQKNTSTIIWNYKNSLPAITGLSPGDAAVYRVNLTATFSVNDLDNDTVKLNLTVNGSVTTNESVILNQTMTISTTNMSTAGSYFWNITVLDGYGAFPSQTRVVILEMNPPFVYHHGFWASDNSTTWYRSWGIWNWSVEDDYFDAFNATCWNPDGTVLYTNYSSGHPETYYNQTINLTFTQDGVTVCELCAVDSAITSPAVPNYEARKELKDKKLEFRDTDSATEVDMVVSVVDDKKSKKDDSLIQDLDFIVEEKYEKGRKTELKYTIKMKKLAKGERIRLRYTSNNGQKVRTMPYRAQAGLFAFGGKYYSHQDLVDTGWQVEMEIIDDYTVDIYVWKEDYGKGEYIYLDPITGAGNKKCVWSEFTVDAPPYNISITGTQDPDPVDYGSSVEFTANVTFNETILGNATVKVQINQSNFTMAYNASRGLFVYNLSSVKMALRNHTVVYYANMSGYDNGKFTGNLTVQDTTGPTVSLVQPANGTAYSFDVQNNIKFYFNVSDTHDTSGFNCSFYIDNAMQGTKQVNLSSGTNYLFNYTPAQGSYLWKVVCLDNSSNTGNSSSYNFSVQITGTAGPTGGDSGSSSGTTPGPTPVYLDRIEVTGSAEWPILELAEVTVKTYDDIGNLIRPDRFEHAFVPSDGITLVAENEEGIGDYLFTFRPEKRANSKTYELVITAFDGDRSVSGGFTFRAGEELGFFDTVQTFIPKLSNPINTTKELFTIVAEKEESLTPMQRWALGLGLAVIVVVFVLGLLLTLAYYSTKKKKKPFPPQ